MAAAGLTVFVAALVVLRAELSHASLAVIRAGIAEITPARIVAAILLTALNYGVLAASDMLALRSIGRRLPAWRVAVTSFLAYAIANNVGFAMVSGSSIRFRFYARWGICWDELCRIVIANATTFWMGLLALGGLSLALAPWPIDAGPLAWSARPVGWLLVAISTSIVVLAIARRGESIRIWALTWPPPSVPVAIGQWLISVADWAIAAAVLLVLLPPGHVPLAIGIGAFCLAQLAGLASHVPGGLGVFEGSIVILLAPYASATEVASALVIYRAIYYLLPLLTATGVLLVDEYGQRRDHAIRAVAVLGRFAEQVTPQALAVLTFLAGVVLLFSGATPALADRLEFLDRFAPLLLVESSHFAASLIGVLLLLLSQGIARRLDAAYHLAVLAAACGIAASLLKGVDIEEAIVLGFVLLALRQARGRFDRRAALLATPFSPSWMAAVAAALIASFWLGDFAFKHVEYRHELWWQFALSGDAPRFLRASVGASMLALLFASARLFVPAPHEIEPPSDRDLDDAAAIISRQSCTPANLVFLRDKGVIFNAARTCFLMYGVQGRTWVAMGDPVGPPDCVAETALAFLERCDDFGGTPVFYQARKGYLHHYADLGLSVVKLGEEARVDLAGVHVEGGGGARYRQAIRRLEKSGATFRMVRSDQLPGLLGQLRHVSDHWLGHKPAEKGFSLGFFDEGYLSRFPLAVVERKDGVIAFANVWASDNREEVSLDLMRYDDRAPSGVMESLIAELILWAKGEGYRWFSLGMAPLSGLVTAPSAPMWSRLGALVYQHGEPLYHFQGLRAFKEKFHPVWEPRYLAYRGSISLPRTLADVTALISGGSRRSSGAPLRDADREGPRYR